MRLEGCFPGLRLSLIIRYCRLQSFRDAFAWVERCRRGIDLQRNTADWMKPAPKKQAWKKWGPYLSERQWGTVREDYSEDGSAWEYFTHDQAQIAGLPLG